MALESFAVKEPQVAKKAGTPPLPSLVEVAQAVADGKLKAGSIIEFELTDPEGNKKTLKWKLNLPKRLWVAVSDKPRRRRTTTATATPKS